MNRDTNRPPRTLMDVMVRQIQGDGSKVGHHFFNVDTQAFDWVPRADLMASAFSYGHELARKGVRRGDLCMLVVSSPRLLLVAFYGAISIGAIPMIFPGPKALRGERFVVERVEFWRSNFGDTARVIVETDADGQPIVQLSEQYRVYSLSSGLMETLGCRSAPAGFYAPSPNDVAYLQMTSASTGTPKAVAISHANVLANVQAIALAGGNTTTERMCSWLPLYHDMGLVGAELVALYYSYPMVMMSPYDFLKRPFRWPKAISDFRCTISLAPNFAYDYCARLVSESQVTELDLSHWRIAFNGAEPVCWQSVERFSRRFSPAGFRADTIRPCYGLAEATLAVTIPRERSVPSYLVVDPKQIGFNRTVGIVSSGRLSGSFAHHDGSNITAFSLGTAVPEHSIYLIDENGDHVNNDLCCGEIVVRGDSVALGYVSGPGGEIDRFEGREFRTGDLGFLAKGELYVLDRLKNVIIRNGQNYISTALESQLARLLDLTDDKVAVFESNLFDPESDIVAVIEGATPQAYDALEERIEGWSPDAIPVSRFVFLKTRAIPRTSSGKKRHFMCRKLLAEDQLPVERIVEMC